MNIVARSDLNFQGKAIVPVTGMTGIWLTSAEIANALQYKSAKISNEPVQPEFRRVYQRNDPGH